MSTIGTAVMSAVMRAVPMVAKGRVDKWRSRKIADAASLVFVTDSADRLLDELNPNQVDHFSDFVSSPQFGYIVTQSLICTLGGYKDEVQASLRNQVRSRLKLSDAFTGAQLVNATDAVLEVVNAAVFAVRTTGRNLFDNDRAIAVGAQVATSAARNSELLEKLRNIGEINTFASKMRSQIKKAHSKVRLPDVVESKSVAYSRLYVEPTLEVRAEFDGEANERNPGGLLAQRRRAVILGDPGAGKSTLAEKFAYDLSTNRWVDFGSQVPLLLTVRNHATQIRATQDTLVKHLDAACRKPYGVEPPVDAVEYLLLNGSATVIIDGLDELGDSSERLGFTRMIESFSDLYPLTRILVTSRSIGYRHAALDDTKFQEARIADFSDEQVLHYARSWFSLARSEEHEVLSRAFISESESISDLRSNPLMLSLLCVLYAREHFIPQNRPEIYEKCAELLFQNWDRSRGLQVAFPYRTFVRPAVQRLAWKMFTDEKRRQALPRDDVVNFLIASVMGNRFDDRFEAEQTAIDFLTFCEGRAWVLTDVGSSNLQPLYGFVHRTFLEYFAAAQLVKQKPDPGSVYAVIRPHVVLNEGEWDVVSRLSVQILDQSYDGGGEALLNSVVDEALTHSGGVSQTLLTFAVNTLEVITPSMALLRKIVTAAVVGPCRVLESERLHLTDVVSGREHTALYSLLRNSNPENIGRIAKLVVESLRALLDQWPYSSSTTMAYGLLASRKLGSSQCLEDIAKLIAAEPLPPRVLEWIGDSYQPTSDTVSRRGISYLYSKWSFLGTVRSMSFVAQAVSLLTVRDGGVFRTYQQAPDITNSLAALYPAVHRIEDLASSVVPVDRMLVDLISRVECAALAQISPDARATALLLILPVLNESRPYQLLNQIRPGEFRDPRFETFATARYEESRRTAALHILDEFDIPAEAHSRLVRWVLGAQYSSRRS